MACSASQVGDPGVPIPGLASAGRGLHSDPGPLSRFICGSQHVCLSLSQYQASMPHLKCIYYLIKSFLFGIIASNFNFLTRAAACQPARQWRTDRR